jgi:hypothetical protein
MNPAGRVRWATAIATSPSKARIFLLRVVTVMARGRGGCVVASPGRRFRVPGGRGAETRRFGRGRSGGIGAPSIAQIEKLIGELHEARNLLESERERIQRETARYIKFTQMASASVKIISDTLSGWRQAGHPLSEFITRSPADDSTGRMGRSFGSAPDV